MRFLVCVRDQQKFGHITLNGDSDVEKVNVVILDDFFTSTYRLVDGKPVVEEHELDKLDIISEL